MSAISFTIKSNKKRVILACALAVPLFTMSGASTDIHNANCTVTTNAEGQMVKSCVVRHSANNSWLHWLAGSSRSSHYQFIDLFELVYSHKEDKHASVLSAREG